jgi:hypothetical protein
MFLVLFYKPGVLMFNFFFFFFYIYIAIYFSNNSTPEICPFTSMYKKNRVPLSFVPGIMVYTFFGGEWGRGRTISECLILLISPTLNVDLR